MRNYIGFAASLCVFFAVLLAVEAFLAAWWDLPESSLLPLFAAGLVVVLPVFIFKRPKRPLFQDGIRWSGHHIVASSAVLAGALILFSLVSGVIVRETWRENLALSAGAGGVVFVTLLLIGYVERFVRRREATKRGIAPEDYKPGKLARRVGWTLAVVICLYLAVGLIVELTNVV